MALRVSLMKTVRCGFCLGPSGESAYALLAASQLQVDVGPEHFCCHCQLLYASNAS